MRKYALPCIVCGKRLENVFPDMDHNQPSRGISARSGGNYGSTAFDSFNHEYLTFNVCDECLILAGERGNVEITRDHPPVVLKGIGDIGRDKVENDPVKWDIGLPPAESVTRITVKDLDNLPDDIELRFPVEQIKSYLESED